MGAFSRPPPPELDRGRPVLVVRVGHSPLLNHGAVGAIRSLGRVGVPTYALTEDRAAPVGASRYLTGRFVWPVTGAEDPRWLVAGLRRICASLDRPAIALPTSDEAAVLLAEHRQDLADMLVQHELAPDLPRRLIDKASLFELCSAHRLPTPRTLTAGSADELADAVEHLGLPVVVKNADLSGRLGNPIVSTTTRLSTAADVDALSTALEQGGAKRLLVQEFVPEDGLSDRPADWFAHVYCARDGTIPLVFTGRKLHSWPPDGGVTARGVAVANPELAELVRHTCGELGYRGIGDMDWRYDARDDMYKLVDFNPRLGAQAQLFRTSAGVDLVRALHLDLTGRPIPPGRQVDGLELFVEHLDAAATFVEWRRAGGNLGVGPLTAPAAPVSRRETAWFAWDDPLPFAVVTARFGRNIAVKTLRRIRGRARPAG
ncbi:hypothetical protein KDL01_26455 [Actinospica durhamensis]|uniref:ATP-grasp domain-containing protein n=1 Tax=Actinospica durhamensis TaxID=1508375 RepID=A0A941IU36_9ACTN|nr:hypothetical protein [Actinospica durhamensis]MBR7836848.1 hypothetical protein [Actinospica durhamensis]